jgi:signal transduction histidine kinase
MLVQAFIFGILIFQVFYVLMQWYFFKRAEFIFYELYVVLFIVYLYAYYEPQIGLSNFFNGSISQIQAFTRIEGLLIFYSYVVFARYFTNASIATPAIARLMVGLEYFLLAGFILQIPVLFITSNNSFREIFSWFFFIPGFSIGLVIGFKLIQQKVRLNTYVIVGSLCAILGSFIQAIVDAQAQFFGDKHHTSSLIMEIGFICEFIFLNIGFMYKNKLQQELQLQVQQDLLAATIEKNSISDQLHNVRTKLSMDLHDDVSSSIGHIRILSSLNEQNLSKADNLISIKRAIDELAQNVNVLVWSFNEKNDTLQHFVEYAKTYIQDTLEPTGLLYSVKANVIDRGRLLNGNTRKQLMLCLKEVIHNIIKHAQCKEVNISIEANSTDHLQIKVVDDGIGLQQKINTAGGNGLANITKRMAAINGNASFTSDEGTCVVLKCKY